MDEKKNKVEMQVKEVKEPKLVIIEPIPTVLVDGFHGLGIVNNSVRINLYEEKFDPTNNEISRHVITRLAIPIDGFLSFSETLWQIRESILSSTEKKEDSKDGK